ncbi:hypothetical protein EV191_112170 [Tamaricihabitans halophyticus]|uniref:Uncharacterized protein n=1 Tax=Tamaricihabitans halophyticus TaxID=1262583 RepID=A0A4R2QFS2_9PSEU|nr:hypothetical protein EV191_112170 [Tamaricihabitans halophyticus]
MPTAEGDKIIKRTKLAFVAAVGAAVLAVSACSDETSGEAAAGTATETTEQEEIDSDAGAEDDDAQGAPADGDTSLTEPGSELSVGDRAIIEHRDDIIGITVTSIEEMDRDEFQEQASGSNLDKIIPYQIRYTVENVDGSDLGNLSPPTLRGVTADGGSTRVSAGISVDGCERSTAPREFGNVGDSFETCTVDGGQEGADLGGAAFNQDDYRENPIIWKA